MTLEPSFSKKLKNPTNADKISELPDAILSRILSFLQTVEGASTSVLSSRWKNLWRSTTKLRFDNTLPPFHCESLASTDPENVKFTNFVNRVLLLHHSTQFVEEFCLRLYQSSELYDVGVWIRHAIMKGVQILDLHVEYGSKAVHLPSSLFSCETLEVLKLDGRSIFINVPTRCSLPKLRTMNLKSVMYQDDVSTCRLIASCPTLESLDITRHRYDNVAIFTILSSSLTKIRFHTSTGSEDAGVEPKLRIDCSAVQRVFVSSEPFTEIHNSLFTSKTLETLDLEYVSLVPTSKSSLPNVRTLKLNYIHRKCYEFLSDLISSCTSLESLHISREGDGDDDIIQLNISSTTLRVLHIQKGDEHYGDENDFKKDLKLSLNAPALQRLALFEYGMEDCHIGNLSSLEIASIHFNLGSTCRSIYQAIQSVKILTIEVVSLSALIVEHGLPTFHRLTVLTVRLTMQCGRWKMLQELIKNSNKLEVLNVALLDDEEDGHEKWWRDFQRVPKCLLSSLRKMSIDGMNSSEDELAMVEYFLMNSRVMHTMKISGAYTFNDQTKIKLLQKVLGFCRGSDKCKVLIS